MRPLPFWLPRQDVRAWNPALHPRGPDGRFTQSFARRMNVSNKKRAAKTKAGFKARAPFKSSQDAGGWLAKLSGKKSGDFASLHDTNRQLRAGKPAGGGFEALLKPTPEDVTAYRSVPLQKFGGATPTDLKGFLVSDAGYFPTSLAPTAPQPGEVRMQIDVPAGTMAVASPDSSELVLDAGVEMSVDEVTTNPDGSAQMRLTVLPTEDSPEGSSAPEGPAQAPVGSAAEAIDSMPAILQNDEAGREWQRRAVEQLGSSINGTFAGLTTQVTFANRFNGGPEGDDTGVTVRIRITDADGNQVGEAERAIYRDGDGNLAAVHELLDIDPEVRGQGFASAFNQHLTDWYRQQGVERIELTANIDVGGYAWASHGYDFADEDSAQRIANRLMEHVDSAPPDVRQAARELLARFDRPFGSDGFPTPFEVSRLGRAEGAKSWLGKTVLLNSSWEGVKWLDHPTPASRP
jgi:hypothetical protein